MRFYPDTPLERTRTIVRDLLVLALLALFAWLALLVHDTVDELAVLGRGVYNAGAAVDGGFDRAARAVDGTPLVGDDLAESLRGAGEASGGRVAELGRRGEERVHRAADVAGLVTFAVPAVLLLLQTLPRRLAQIHRLTDAQRVLAPAWSPERRRVVAMRAAFSLPYADLLRHTPDPLGDLAAGRYDALVRAAFEDAGLRPRNDSSAAAVSTNASQ